MSRKATIRESYEWLCECVRCTTESSVGKFLPWRTLNDHYLKSFRNSSTRVGPDDSASAPQTWFDKRKEDLDMLALNQRTELRTARLRPTSELARTQQPPAAEGRPPSHPSSSSIPSTLSSALANSSIPRAGSLTTGIPATFALNASNSNSSLIDEPLFDNFQDVFGGGNDDEEDENLDHQNGIVVNEQDGAGGNGAREVSSRIGGAEEAIRGNLSETDLDREGRERGELPGDGIQFLPDEVDDPRLQEFIEALDTLDVEDDEDEDVLNETNENRASSLQHSQQPPPPSTFSNTPPTDSQSASTTTKPASYSPGPKPLFPPSPLPDITDDERLSLKLRFDNLKRGSTQAAYNDNIKTWKEEGGRNVLSIHAVDKLAKSLSGVREVKVDICPNGCMAYAGPHKDKTFCDQERKATLLDANGVVVKTASGNPKKKTVICNRSRYKSRGSDEPVRSIIYFSLVDRMRYLFKRKDTALGLRSLGERLRRSNQFRHRAGGDERPAAYDDFGDGDHLNTLFESKSKSLKELFEDERTTFFNISTDGAILKLGRDGDFWSIESTITNLPIEMGRYQRQFQWTVALIPAKLPPVDLESFFYPLKEELDTAKEGYWFWDAAAEEYFLWKGAWLLLLADQMGMVKLSGMIGSRGYSPCWFCEIVRCYANTGKTGMYCPLHTVKLSIPEKEELNHDRADYDPSELPMRTPESLRTTAYKFVNSSNRTQISRSTGVSRISLFMRSPLYLHPSSTPSDISHLLFEDTGKSYWELLVKSHISQAGLGRIRDLYEVAYQGLPSSICSGKARSIVDFFNTSYKMWEMVVWIVWYSIPMLYEAEVDNKVIEVWGRFVALVVKVLDRSSLTPSRVDEIRSIAIEHAQEFEKLFVNNVLANVSLVTISFHFLLHLANNITWHGHPSLYSQFPMERKLGWLKRLIRQFSNEYRTLELELSRHLHRDAVLFQFPDVFPLPAPQPPSRPPLLFKTAIWKKGSTRTVDDQYWKKSEQLVQEWILQHLTTPPASTSPILTSFCLKTRNHSRIFASLSLSNGAVVRSLRAPRKVDGREGYHVLGRAPGGARFFATVISFIELHLPTASISAAPSHPYPSTSKSTYSLKPLHSFYRLALVFYFPTISEHFSDNQSPLLAQAQIAPFVDSNSRTIELIPVELIQEVVGVLQLSRKERIYIFQSSSVVSSHVPSSRPEEGLPVEEDDEEEEEPEEEGEGDE